MASSNVIYRLMLALLACCASSCGSDGQSTREGNPAEAGERLPPGIGWTYLPDRTTLIYRFGDAGDTEFTGICMGRPRFMLTGNAYPRSIRTFELVVDGQSSILPAVEHQHGRELPVDDAESVQRLADAKQQISIRMGAWSRKLPVSPLLRRFVRECDHAVSHDLPTQTFR